MLPSIWFIIGKFLLCFSIHTYYIYTFSFFPSASSLFFFYKTPSFVLFHISSMVFLLFLTCPRCSSRHTLNTLKIPKFPEFSIPIYLPYPLPFSTKNLGKQGKSIKIFIFHQKSQIFLRFSWKSWKTSKTALKTPPHSTFCNIIYCASPCW